jgi:hypothetical protein
MPALPDLVIPLVLLAALIGLIAIKTAWTHTLGAVLEAIGRALPGSILGISIGTSVLGLNRTIEDNLGRYILNIESTLGKWWQSMENLYRWTYDIMTDFTSDVTAATNSLVYGTIPHAIKGGTAALKGGIAGLSNRMLVLERTLEGRLTHRTRALEAEIAHDFGLAWRGIDAVPQKIRGAVAHVLDVVAGAIAAGERTTRGWVNRHYGALLRLVGVGAFAGAVASVLTRIFPYWQCSNVKSFNKKLCRSPLGSLDWLFGLALGASMLVDPKEVIRVAEEVEGILDAGIREMAGISDLSFAEAEADVLAAALRYLGL